jgi:hypothetical protein
MIDLRRTGVLNETWSGGLIWALVGQLLHQPAVMGCRPALMSRVRTAQSRDEWRPPSIASQAVVVDLIDVYFEVVYPMYACRLLL